jgi:anaerobic ribonucleoside-triphosphate reductase
MYVNLVFAVASQYAGAVATPEVLLLFDYFSRKEWGDDYWTKTDLPTTVNSNRPLTIRQKIHQHFQQIIYSINQPAASRGMQSAFVNFGYFDKPFFEGMFGDFYFPDGTKPIWESLCWLQKEFMTWFNEERSKCILTFPVESFALVYQNGEFLDKDSAEFVAQEYSRGHSFFTYISDTVDSLSSCCFSKDQKVLWRSSSTGVHLTTLEELHNTKWEPDKKNLKIFHNGSWVSGKSIKLPNTNKMYKVTTYNNKEFIMTDNHINVTLGGEKNTSELTTDDYLMFNTIPLQAIPENEHLSYEQGFVIGAFLGDGSFGSEIKGTIYDISFSQNINKYQRMMEMINIANQQVGGQNTCSLSEVYNNVYPVRISSKELVSFIIKWTNWERGTLAHNKKLNLNCLLQSSDFRKGILDGWYNTDGGNSNRCYTTSPELAEDMEILITSLGLQSIINVSDRTDEEVIIRDKVYNRNYPLYCVKWYEPGNHRVNKDIEKSWIKKNNSIYFKIKSIEEVDYTDSVYCIECRNQEEPYFTLPCGLITHNCRLKNKIQTKEFNFTNGNIGVQTGSKSVISLNLSRITQNWVKQNNGTKFDLVGLGESVKDILERVYKYHIAYNELLWDMNDAGLLPVCRAGFINLDKQYLTIGLNGLNQAAEFLGITCNDNPEYSMFCQFVFGTIKDFNTEHNGKYFGHKVTFNTECVPAESLAIKNYNWDKEDGYWVPSDTNLYASYIFKPNDPSLSVLDKLRMHGSNYIGDFLDGGSAAHINIDHHFSVEQYRKLIKYAAEQGCQYFTFNCINSECRDCGHIAKEPFDVCPICGSNHIDHYDRIIGYITKIRNWSSGRQIEQKTRIYSKEC